MTESRRLGAASLAIFAAMLAISLSGAQVAALLIAILAVVSAVRERGVTPEVRTLLLLALGLVGSLALISLFQGGPRAAVAAVRNTWPVVVAPAVALMWRRCGSEMILRIWSRLFILAAVIYLGQYSLYGYDTAKVWRYGFHSSPYVSAMLFIGPTLYLIGFQKTSRLEFIVTILFGVTIMALNSRGAIMAWITALAVIFLASPGFGALHSRKFLVSVAIFLIFVVGLPNRWRVADLSHQGSIVHRLVVWTEVIGQIGERPFFGHGFGEIRPEPERFAPEYRIYVSEETNPHNSYLLVAHGGGLVGYVIFWTVHASVLWMLVSRFRRDRSRLESRVAIANLMGLFVAGFADQIFFTTLPMLQHWFLCGVALSGEHSRVGTPVG